MREKGETVLLLMDSEGREASEQEATGAVEIEVEDGRVVRETWYERAEQEKKGGPGSGHHGHSGRPGQRGGSTPGTSTGSLAALKGAVLEGDELNQAHEATGIVEQEMNGWSGQWGSWRNADMHNRAALKHDITYQLTKRLKGGVRENVENEEWTEAYDQVEEVVKQWAFTSNDTDMRSLAIQQDAAKEFGLPLSEFTKDGISMVNLRRREIEDEFEAKWSEENIQYKLDEAMGALRHGYPVAAIEVLGVRGVSSLPYDTTRADLENMLRRAKPAGPTYEQSTEPLLPSSDQRAILRAMYDETQSKLKEMGFKPGDKIDIYRGAVLPLPKGIKRGDVIDFTGNAIESWSIAEFIARRFARSRTGEERGRPVVLRTSVPIEMILSTCMTGFGCLTEGEITVLGSDGQAEVTEVGVIP